MVPSGEEGPGHLPKRCVGLPPPAVSMPHVANRVLIVTWRIAGLGNFTLCPTSRNMTTATINITPPQRA